MSSVSSSSSSSYSSGSSASSSGSSQATGSQSSSGSAQATNTGETSGAKGTSPNGEAERTGADRDTFDTGGQERDAQRMRDYLESSPSQSKPDNPQLAHSNNPSAQTQPTHAQPGGRMSQAQCAKGACHGNDTSGRSYSTQQTNDNLANATTAASFASGLGGAFNGARAMSQMGVRTMTRTAAPAARSGATQGASKATTGNPVSGAARNSSAESAASQASRAGHNGVQGAPNHVTRTTRAGGKGVNQKFPDGSKKDITANRVKEFTPNSHPSAPPGAMNRVRFENAQRGSKGFKRNPTPQELEVLK